MEVFKGKPIPWHYTIFCHAELVSASHGRGVLPCDGVEILKRVQDDKRGSLA